MGQPLTASPPASASIGRSRSYAAHRRAKYLSTTQVCGWPDRAIFARSGPRPPRGTGSSNPPPSTGESGNFWFLAAEPSWRLSKPLEPPAVIPATRPASMGYRPCAARQQSLDHGHGSSVTAAASGPSIAVRPPGSAKTERTFSDYRR